VRSRIQERQKMCNSASFPRAAHSSVFVDATLGSQIRFYGQELAAFMHFYESG